MLAESIVIVLLCYTRIKFPGITGISNTGNFKHNCIYITVGTPGYVGATGYVLVQMNTLLQDVYPGRSLTEHFQVHLPQDMYIVA